MEKLNDFQAFADQCVPDLADAIETRDFAAFNRFFDPDLPDRFTEDDFLKELDEQADLGDLESFEYLGCVKGDQETYPGAIRFVYRGEFTNQEALIILCLHERNGKKYLNEHVYYYG